MTPLLDCGADQNYITHSLTHSLTFCRYKCAVYLSGMLAALPNISRAVCTGTRLLARSQPRCQFSDNCFRIFFFVSLFFCSIRKIGFGTNLWGPVWGPISDPLSPLWAVLFSLRGLLGHISPFQCQFAFSQAVTVPLACGAQIPPAHSGQVP